jgi:hypothetical protein
MKRLLQFSALLGLLCSTLVQAGGMVITSQDYVLKPENVRIEFTNNIFREKAEVFYRTCSSCTWLSHPTTDKTYFHDDYIKVSFPDFKRLVAKPIKDNRKVLISISHHSNSVRVLKWNYEAL